MIKSNIDKEMIKSQISEQEKIFTIENTYHVAVSVSDYWINDKSAWVETTLTNYQKAYIVITELENGIVNIRFTQKQWPAERYANYLFDNANKNKLKISDSGDFLIINLTTKNKIKICKKTFNLLILNEIEEVITETNLRKGYDYLEGYITPPLGFKQISNDTKKPFISLELKNNELIYGLGEKFMSVVKNGRTTNIYNVDPSSTCNHNLAYGGVPFIISNFNYGILLNSGYRTTFEIGAPVSDSISMMSDEEYLEMFVFFGDSMKDVINKYTDLTGKISGVPDEAYGIWLNRLYYHNKEELFLEIKNAKKFNFPLDVITLDPKWIKNRYTKTCNFIFNDEAFGDFKSLLSEVHKFNVKMCFWINPYFQVDNTDDSKYVVKNGLLVKSSKSEENYAHPWSGIDKHIEAAGLIDFTNPDGVKWYKDKIKYLLENGVDFIKTDYGDGLPQEAVMFNGCNGAEFKQHYIYLYLKTAYEATQEFFGKEKGFVLSRPAFTGTNKFVGKWSGDSVQSFNELKLHLQAGISLSFCGNVMWGTDIGGFQPYHKKEKDLYVRWTQLGMLNPFSRYHGIGPREPWYFGKEELDAAVKYSLIKKQLLPYFKICEKDSIKKGIPIIRALGLEFQKDKVASIIEDQFMLGDSIMVAPILSDNTYERQVYFPEGKWFNFFNPKEVYEGNSSKFLKCSLDEILVFVRENSIIPIMERGNYNFQELKEEKITINVYGKQENKVLSFKLNGIDNEISVIDDKIKVISNHSHKIVKFEKG